MSQLKVNVITNLSNETQYTPTLMTAQASTAGTGIDFTGIPSWAKRITVIFSEVSTSGTSNLWLRVGSGSIVTSGYTSRFDTFNSGPITQTTSSAFGLFDDGTAASTRSAIITLVNISGNTWVEAHTGSSTSGVSLGSGSVTLSGNLDRLQITTANGTDTFDAGTINVMYE